PRPQGALTRPWALGLCPFRADRQLALDWIVERESSSRDAPKCAAAFDWSGRSGSASGELWPGQRIAPAPAEDGNPSTGFMPRTKRGRRSETARIKKVDRATSRSASVRARSRSAFGEEACFGTSGGASA